MKILLSTDFSESSENAIIYVLKMVRNWGAIDISYVLVYGFKPLIPYTNVPSMPVMKNEELEEKLRQKFNDLLVKLKEKVEIKGFFQKGDLPNVINAIVKKEKPDFIVMGTREGSALERSSVGSNTMEVAFNANCPVLAVPREASFDGIKKMVITTDLEPLNIAHDSLVLVKNLMTLYGCNTSVLHVFEEGDPKELKNKLKDITFHRYLSQVAHDHDAVVNKSVFDGIIDYINEKRPELMVAIPRGRGFFEGIFHSSVTEKMVYHAQIPILILV
ncbi:MAG: nucleotide-binding universal stress UspA family protein [Cyclobacteriaceae bacterium]|jgi:nucleotide-binding universal stress UspA family protein